MLTLAASQPSAAGADIGQIAIATGGAVVLTLALFHFGFGHRNGRVPHLGRAAAAMERLTGIRGWAVLPASIAAVSLITALFGLQWDVSLHIDNGRDPGPLANPSHYLILLGLFGILAAGWIAIVLPDERPGPAAIRIAGDWHAPVGGVLMMACASFALAGFPLDDLSHRLFGQDVTLWGPTHLMMLSGAAMTLVGILVLLAEARAARLHEAGGEPTPRPVAVAPRVPLVPRALVARIHAITTSSRTLRIAGCGGLLIGLSIYQGEFDYGVPQFRLIFEPLLIALAAGCALTCARIIAGRGAAIWAAVFFLVVRGAMTVIVGPVFGEATSHFPLYLGQALLVEAAALLFVPSVKPWRFALSSGVLIGTLGTLIEYGWSQVWMPVAWPAHLLPQAVLVATIAGVGAAVLGAFAAGGMTLRPALVTPRAAWVGALAALVIVSGLFAFLLPTRNADPAIRVAATLQDVPGAAPREVVATLRVTPANALEDADWLRTISWQGKQPLEGAELTKLAPGVYRTAPLPVTGSWKSILRFHRGRVLAGVPIYLPADDAIPVAGVPAAATFSRAFEEDHRILQRERRADVPGWAWPAAGVVVMLFIWSLLLLLGWGLRRVGGIGSIDGTRSPTGTQHRLLGGRTSARRHRGDRGGRPARVRLDLDG